jgi:hypothetical protein
MLHFRIYRALEIKLPVTSDMGPFLLRVYVKVPLSRLYSQSRNTLPMYLENPEYILLIWILLIL